MQSRFYVGNALAALLMLGVGACDGPTTTPSPVASVTVTPGELNLEPGGGANLTATLKDAAGKELTNRQITWSSDPADIASVSPTGRVEAHTVGTANITAKSEGQEGRAIITVSPAPVAHMDINPARVVLTEGESAQLAATPRDAAGRPLSDRPVTWSSTNEDVAVVDATGLVRAKRVGQAFIVATSEGREGRAELSVTARTVASVAVSPSAVILEWNGSRQLAAQAFDGGGEEVTGRAVQWSTNNAAVAVVSAAGLVEARGEGLTQIMAMIDGKHAYASVEVAPAPVARVIVTPALLDLEAGENMSLAVRLEDPLGRPLSRPVTWASDDPAVAQVTAAGRVYAFRKGRAVVTATSEGVSASVPVAVAPFPTYDLIYDRQVAPDGAEVMLLALGSGNGPVKLNAGDVSRHPSPSPDGSRFVFSVFQNDFATGQPVHDLFIVNRNGTGMRRLTDMPGIESEPVWSPDGQRIAFTGWNPATETHDVFVVNVDGTGLVSLTEAMGTESEEMQPAWSADGRRIAFAARPSSGPGSARIWIMNADGTGHAALATDAGYDVHPTWSPDGERIAFQRYTSATRDTDIMIAPVSGGAAVQLARAGDQYQPVWSPDGEHIAFIGRTPSNLGGFELYTMRPDGTGVRLRTTDPAWRGGSNPAWIRRF